MINKMIHTPEGVRDIYGNELERRMIVKSKLHHTLASYGYSDIKTPTFEFSDIYSNVGTTPEKEMYRFFDKEGNMISLRPDFTPSVARCAAKYFLEESMPIRLCYEGNTFTNTSDFQGKLKETTQMGAELMNTVESPDSDAEMICLVIEALLNTGLKSIQISIGNAMYFKGICEQCGLSEEDIYEVREYMSLKDYFGAESHLRSIGVKDKYISAILDVTKISSFKELKTARDYVDNEKSLNAIDYLEKVYSVIKMYGFEEYVSVDLGMLSKFNYYTGMVFKGYTYGTGDAIVKGGRYDSLLGNFGKPTNAVGAVFLVDDLMTALSSQNLLPEISPKNIWVVYSEAKKKEAIKRAKAIREDGRNCALVLMDDKHSKDEINSYATSHDVVNVEFFV